MAQKVAEKAARKLRKSPKRMKALLSRETCLNRFSDSGQRIRGDYIYLCPVGLTRTRSYKNMFRVIYSTQVNQFI